MTVILKRMYSLGSPVKVAYTLLLLVLVGCASTLDTKDHDDSPRTDKLCAFMSLDMAFPNESSRQLARAASRGQTRRVQELVDNGVSPNSLGKNNCSVLFWAMGDVNGYRKLLELGADPNVLFDDGGSVMEWSLLLDDARFLELALQFGGDPNLVTGFLDNSLLHEAVAPESKDKLHILIDAGANLGATNESGRTPLMRAAGLGQFDVVLELLNEGADFRSEDNVGQTLADVIEFRYPTMDPNNSLTRQMHLVVDWLGNQGVAVRLTD